MHLRFSATSLVLPLLLLACSDSPRESATGDLQPTPTPGEGATPDDGEATPGDGSEPAVAEAVLTGVEVPGADCAVASLPEFDALTDDTLLPNPFTMLDGTPVTTKAQWACRHRELRAMFEKYETGVKTEKPAEVTGSLADGTLLVNVSDGAGRTASFPVTITYPAGGTGPYPAMIGINGGSLNSARLQEQGVALINFPKNDVRPEGDRSAGAFTAFTGQTDSGSLIALAWGVSRVIDAIEATPDANIKADRLGITGCSRDGKGALVIGAMDSRIALTIPQESGSGGAATWRAAEFENETQPQGCENPANPAACVQKLSSTYTETQWFGTSIAQFANAVNRLPVDHHELIGLGAPRGMLALGNIGWIWLGRYASVQGMNAARQVYQALGVDKNIGFVESGHQHCNNMDFTGREQEAIDAFVAKFLLDQEVSTDFWDESVGYDAQRWVNWETPILQ